MTRRIPPLDPDPLHVEPVQVVIRCRACGERLPWGRIGECDDCLGRGGNAAAWIVLAFVVLVACVTLAVVGWFTAPRSAPESSPAPGLFGAPSTPQAAVSTEEAAGAPRYRGTATWYCSDGRDGSPTSGCTRGYGPSDLVAAIDRKDSEFRKGDRVLVRAGDASVVVTIVDTCACVDARVIDLTIGAFQELAPWGLGVIPVTLEAAGSERTLPPTETAP